MPAVRTFPTLSPDELLQLKRDTTVSVCIPARDEEATVADVVAGVVALRDAGLVDEVVVVDDGSADRTAARARAAGARVISSGGRGKGAALHTGMEATDGDIVAFCDADVQPFAGALVSGLLGPLLTDASVALVKASYRRPLHGRPDEGGRVTELTARPALQALFPALAAVSQPLAGEWAARREVLERVPFPAGYGVDIGVLIDVHRGWGAHSVAQVELGERSHRNRPLSQLGPMAAEVLRTVLSRAGMVAAAPPDLAPTARQARPA
jgi:glucosyl-3-phosphoglycerate synthase